jgi:hypothetical protein
VAVAVYRDIEGELHPKSETSRHHIIAKSLTGGGFMRKFINQALLTPRMLNDYHFPGPEEALHTNVELLRPPPTFVAHSLQEVIDNIDSGRHYDRLIEFVDRVDQLSTSSSNGIMRRECGRLAEGMELQMPYILIGQVEVIRTSGQT